MKLFKIKTIITSVALMAAFFSVTALPALSPSVYAQPAPSSGGAAPAPVTDTTITDGLCQGSTLEFGDNKNCKTQIQTSATSLNKLIKQIINIFSVIVAIVAVIMIIIGGFKYITSGGDSNKVGSAKNTILYAIVGLIIVALAQFIVKFVLTQTTSLDKP